MSEETARTYSIFGRRLLPIRFGLTWEALLGVRSNGLLRVSQFGLIVVPALARLVLLLDAEADRLPTVPLQGIVHRMVWALPLGWVELFGLSATIFAANVIVDAACPREVRVYATRASYETALLEELRRRREAEREITILDEREIRERLMTLTLDKRFGALADDLANPRKLDALAQALAQTRSASDPANPSPDEARRRYAAWPTLIAARPWLRLIITILYGIAAVLAAMLGLVQSAWRVGEATRVSWATCSTVSSNI